MPKNIIMTKKGNFGKVNKLIPSKIRTEKGSPIKSLNREMGIRSEGMLGSIKREKVK